MGERIDITHVMMPFCVPGSTLMKVAQWLTDETSKCGAISGAILTEGRGLELRADDVRYADYRAVSPREWFSRSELVRDVVWGRAGQLRPNYGHLFDPAVDIVHETQPRLAAIYAGHFAAATLPRWERVRQTTAVVLYVHNPLSRTYSGRELKRLLDHADAVAFVADHLRRSTLSRIGRPDDPRFVVVPNGVNPLFLTDEKRSGPPAVFEIVFAGRVWPNKGVHLVLDAAERASKMTSRSLRVRIIGNADYTDAATLTPYEVALRRTAAGMGVPVIFDPFLSPQALRERYAHAAVACLPSQHSEGRPLAALEAMAMGLPVVVSDEPGMVDAVGAAGIVVPGGDPDGMARRMVELADDDDAWLARSSASRAQAAASNWSDVARTLLSFRR